MKEQYIVGLIPGDGIGIEVMNEAQKVFDVLELPLGLKHLDAGWKCWLKVGNPIPEYTWESMKDCSAILLGATTSKPKQEALSELPVHLKGTVGSYVSPIVQLRQKLELYANVRPVHIPSINREIVVIRENTEGLYSGLDYRYQGNPHPLIHDHPSVQKSGGDCSLTIRLQTRFGLERIVEFAAIYASENGHRKIVVADKPNVLRESSELVREVVSAVSERHPKIEFSIENVDAVAMWLVCRPEKYEVIVAENMFGDILSDLLAGLGGGLGIAPSGNYGAEFAYFEPIHGSAPRLAGKGVANPVGMISSLAMLLSYLGFDQDANCVRSAVQKVSQRGILTYDQGGSSSTNQVGDAIVQEIKHGSEN